MYEEVKGSERHYTGVTVTVVIPTDRSARVNFAGTTSHRAGIDGAGQISAPSCVSIPNGVGLGRGRTAKTPDGRLRVRVELFVRA